MCRGILAAVKLTCFFLCDTESWVVADRLVVTLVRKQHGENEWYYEQNRSMGEPQGGRSSQRLKKVSC